MIVELLRRFFLFILWNSSTYFNQHPSSARVCIDHRIIRGQRPHNNSRPYWKIFTLLDFFLFLCLARSQRERKKEGKFFFFFLDYTSSNRAEHRWQWQKETKNLTEMRGQHIFRLKSHRKCSTRSSWCAVNITRSFIQMNWTFSWPHTGL